ncbi:Helix-turn-helix domain-containing protein [Paenibacillus sp. UNCCL117]|uniref:response regulator transcription factor n=1 Tax=unclassified Paenibacillus TaxID=185978 RepID=UPI000881FE73|nr:MULTISPECIES: response regulator [unclassified Paenibacillus]SDE11276.1 Helix-turn-helix domain-containing protein [Paenibacillus sp. cl123]SFW59955.1 Helix-turn-helix domain-containing protein [Paenibacillus sp. UNCCL117]
MLKVLIVDDEQWVRERFSDRIPWADAGFRLIGAAAGAEEAIRMMERDEPHLLMTDITMPNMSGLELATYVRKRWPRVRVVILTAYGEFEYARQAIELGVDNYLIKLAQTPEQILEVCRKAAEAIEQELDIEQKLEMRRKLEWEREWEKKRQWTERLLKDRERAGIGQRDGAWFGSMPQDGHIAALTLGWSQPQGPGPGSDSGGSVWSATEDGLQLQMQIAESLEERLRTAPAGAGWVVLLPVRLNRIHILAGWKQPPDGFGLNRLAEAALDIAEAAAGTNGMVYAGAIRRAGEHPLEAGRIAEGLRQGMDGLASCFYKPHTHAVIRQIPAMRRLDEESAAERMAPLIRALQRADAAAFQEAAAAMTALTEPPLHPDDLLRMTRQLFHPGIVHLPASVTGRLDEVDQLESWPAYCGWWKETIRLVSEWLNGRSLPPSAVRREVQLMCRHIREHYKEDVQVAELAELVHLHPSYAGQLFKQEVGENVSDYLNRVRMEKAGELLEQTTMKIYEVSGAVGISDYRYFCKLFKSYTGSTPTQYKQNNA